MPMSHADNKPVIRNLIKESVDGGARVFVDVGVGYGHIGHHLRLVAPDVTLIGIEIFPEYINDKNMQSRNYNAIIVGNAVDEIENIQNIDVVLMIDVFEHIERDKAVEFLNTSLRISKKVIMGIPIVPYEQGEAFGNKYEAHLYDWSTEEIVSMGGQPVWDNGIVGVFEFTGYRQD